MWPAIGNRFNLAFLDFVMGNSARRLHDWTMVVLAVVYFDSPHSRRTTCNDHEWTVHEASNALSLAGILSQSVTWTVSTTTIAAKPDFCNATRLLIVGNGGCLDYNVVSVVFTMSLNGCDEGVLVWIR